MYHTYDGIDEDLRIKENKNPFNANYISNVTYDLLKKI